VTLGAYDVFGYLAAGLVAVGGLQLLTGFPPVFGAKLDAFGIAAALVGVYVTGHIIATPAKALLEDWLLVKVLGSPTAFLLGQRKGSRAAKLLFPAYHKPLDTFSIGPRVSARTRMGHG
jgi:hypothetical protein